jgi:iron complex transport system ATP-binding protein
MPARLRARRRHSELRGHLRAILAVLLVLAAAGAQARTVMDEPTASLDFGNQMIVLSEVKRLAARGLAVVLSTHDPDHAFSVADRVALLDGGRLIAQGAPAEVLTRERLRAVYGIDVLIEQLSQGQTVCAPDYGHASIGRGAGRP